MHISNYHDFPPQGSLLNLLKKLYLLIIEIAHIYVFKYIVLNAAKSYTIGIGK